MDPNGVARTHIPRAVPAMSLPFFVKREQPNAPDGPWPASLRLAYPRPQMLGTSHRSTNVGDVTPMTTVSPNTDDASSALVMSFIANSLVERTQRSIDADSHGGDTEIGLAVSSRHFTQHNFNDSRMLSIRL